MRGWYAIARSEDIQEEPVQIAGLLGNRFVAWRTRDGLSVADAFCPHLGADLSMGSVEGDRLRCPLHGWLFDPDGFLDEIPYCEKLNKGANLTMHRAIERLGHVWVWQGSNVFPFQGLEVESGWRLIEEHPRQTLTNISDCMENAVDVAHFNQLHQQPPIEMLGVHIPEDDDPRVHMKYLYGEIDLHVAVHYMGPGLGCVRFSGFIDMTTLVHYTPTDDNGTKLCVQFWLPDEVENEALARYMLKEVLRQFDEDVEIWDRRKYLQNPKLCIGDGPILEMRRWARRFIEA